MSDSGKISLRRIVVEIGVIVGSILLAFSIDAWWDERQDRIEEQQILLGLKSEFTRYGEELSEGIIFQADLRMMIGKLMAAARRGSWDPETVAVDLALASLGDSKTHDFGGGILDALISAGRLEIISDHNLRLELATWSQVFNEVRDDELRNRTLVADHVTPYLLRWHISQSRALELCCNSWAKWPVPTRSITDQPGALERMLADPEFEVLLEMKHIELAHVDVEYEIALAAIEEILALIDASLSQSDV